MNSARPVPVLLAAVAAVCLNSCAAVPGRSFVDPSHRKREPHHYYNTPREPDLSGSRVVGVAKLNPVWWGKNSDNPLPEWWRPGEDEATRRHTWYLRNPLHNFTHYVVGVADRDFHRTGVYAPGVWNPHGNWNFAVTHAGPLIHLPFVSHRGPLFEKYIGWRNGGNFGMAFRRSQHEEPKEKEPQPRKPNEAD